MLAIDNDDDNGDDVMMAMMMIITDRPHILQRCINTLS